MEQFIEKILTNFLDKCKILDLSTEHSGLINETFRVKTNQGSFILQKINTKVFKNTNALVNNKAKITNFLNLKKFPTAQFLQSKDGKSSYQINNDIWQLSRAIDSVTYEKIINQEMASKAGSFLASFHNVLLDFPINELKETIPDFHNNFKRFEDFKSALSVADKNKIISAQPEIDTILYFYSIVEPISEAIHNKLLPLRVVHNDTKISNLLFDKYGSILCMIDYDTIMPGCILSDIGDAMRTGACSSAEDEQDLSKVTFRVDIYNAFMSSYIKSSEHFLTELEKYHIHRSLPLILFEQSCRFLVDYLLNDRYYRIMYSDHNLVRARTQIKLFKEVIDFLKLIKN